MRRVQLKTPPMLSGRAGVTVTLHSPAVEENSTGPSGPATLNASVRSGLVSVRLTNDAPERCSSSSVPPSHVTSIGAGGGAHTAGVSIDERFTASVRSPDSVTVATPTRSGLSGPGDAVAIGERVGDGEMAAGAGGEMLGPCPIPVEVHPARSARRAPTVRVLGHVPRIAPSLPHAPAAPRRCRRARVASKAAASIANMVPRELVEEVLRAARRRGGSFS